MLTRPAKLRVYTHDRGDFKHLKGKNVLLYWPHGFGDWVQFSLMLPFLEPGNRYWMTRFGDDTVTLLEGHPIARPVYLGHNSPHCDHGGAFGRPHFGAAYEQIDGGEIELQLPLSLYDVVTEHGIEAMLWTWYPETHGGNPPPFHTKARALVRDLTARDLAARDPAATDRPRFNAPIPRTISLDEDPLLRRLVEVRLKNFCGFGRASGRRRLCILGRGGYTSVGKNWGHLWREDVKQSDGTAATEGEECRAFIRRMLRKSPDWCFLLMEDRNFADSLKDPKIHTFAYSDVFGEPEAAFAPFGRVMKCLARLASLCVGVPAGPYHFAAQVAELPTVGVWIEHLPSWYDEPRDGLVHVIGSHAAARIGREPGSFLDSGEFHFDSILCDGRTVSGEAVMAAAEQVLEGR